MFQNVGQIEAESVVPPTCSFCGAPHHDRTLLISGGPPDGLQSHICERCLGIVLERYVDTITDRRGRLFPAPEEREEMITRLSKMVVRLATLRRVRPIKVITTQPVP